MKWLIALFFIGVGLSLSAQKDSVYTDLRSAIRAGDSVKVLILKRQKLTSFPIEVCALKNLEAVSYTHLTLPTTPYV